MGQYLRDQFVKNTTINEEALEQINDAFIERQNVSNHGVDPDGNLFLFLVYVIRFDNKGYRFFSFQEMRQFYVQATHVERVIFTLESSQSRQSNRIVGAYLEMRLDAGDENGCNLVASADNKNWVDAAFTGVSEILSRLHNRSGWIKNAWTYLVVQIVGVIVGFAISLWAALKIAPHLKFENAFAVSLLFAILVFSNVWTFLQHQIMKGLNYSFPNLRFKRKGRDTWIWLWQGIVLVFVGLVVAFILGKVLDYIGTILGDLIQP